ncbi:unnamed protein product [Adineta steineri]|uniref:Pentapeptide repeat-containing protein n=1 Tax=Adineta steineri TaxID=433720 RepID=A0A813SW80_9BILA|nr:unnamed protein product [Adineta steineri]CAF0798527.1 unnamed protein product [Adineta steineri]CAF0801636.1 unnamed protein product [Adineta steineri]CAF4039155.1 unnamed protein product [Adineta steineri]
MIYEKEFCGLTLRRWLKILVKLTITIIIGVFTIIISIHQQNVNQSIYNKHTAQVAQLYENNREQIRRRRQEDIETVRLQREEDKNFSCLQREEDQKIFNRQREEDRQDACVQRLEDKESAGIQREIDLKLATDKRLQEYKLAEIQRSLYQNKRSNLLEIDQENYLSERIVKKNRKSDDILMNYQRELSGLLSNLQTKLDELDPTFLLVLQMQTKTTLQLLDATRRTILVKNLIQANILRDKWNGKMSILYGANVSGVQFDQLFNHRTISFPDIEHADVRYASFRSVFVRGSSSFAYSDFDYTDWSFAELINFDFDRKMTMNNAIFRNSQMIDVAFHDVLMNQVSFQYNKNCSNCIFVDASLVAARFDHSIFPKATFGLTTVADGNMSSGTFVESDFERVILDRVDLNGADCRRCTFLNVSMVNCSMYDIKLEGANFSHVNLTGCIGLKIEQIYSLLKINDVILPNGTIISF